MDRRPSAPQLSQVATTLTNNGKGSLLTTILIILLILTSLLATVFLGSRLIASASGSGAVKGKQYQALFLTNGQVYFGKLKNVNSEYVKMTDIYYLQVQQQVQPEQNNNNNNQQPQVSLAKLGGELHGPEDTMFISRDQVLFWENMKADGKVADAIKNYRANGDNNQQQQENK